LINGASAHANFFSLVDCLIPDPVDRANCRDEKSGDGGKNRS